MSRAQPAADHQALCADHSRFTDRVGDSVIELQDAAYTLGRKRGKQEANADLLSALEDLLAEYVRDIKEFGNEDPEEKVLVRFARKTIAESRAPEAK